MSPLREAATRADTQKCRNILCNSEVHYSIHKSPTPVPISPFNMSLSYLRSVLILSPPLHLGLLSGLFPPGFPTSNLYASPVLATCPAHLIFLVFIIIIILGEDHKLTASVV
jgi:hypothetical protein